MPRLADDGKPRQERVGQNAGIGLNVPESRGVAAGSSTTLNLRGLGSDATLTLLNGHRLTYGVAQQSVDISTIPVVAIGAASHAYGLVDTGEVFGGVIAAMSLAALAALSRTTAAVR